MVYISKRQPCKSQRKHRSACCFSDIS